MRSQERSPPVVWQSRCLIHLFTKMRSRFGICAAVRSRSTCCSLKTEIVYAAVVGENQGAQARVFAVGRRPARAGLALEPDVGIEADLVAGMA